MEDDLRKSDPERKRVEEVSDHIEKYSRLKLESSLSVSQKMDELELSEIIDVRAIKPLMNDFYILTHIPIGINDLKGNVLVSVGWQDICARFHRIHPETCKHCVESDMILSSGVTPGEFKLYRCKNNMWDIVTPIMVSDRHVGYVFGGQFFFEEESLDYELFRSQARKYGFNEEEYIAALEKVPRLSREAVDTGMGFFMAFANMLSQLSYSNIKLAHTLAERDSLVDKLEKNREDFNRAQAVGNIGSWRLDLCKNEFIWSDETHRIFGIPKGVPLSYETFLSVVHPDDREYIKKKAEAGLKGEPYDVEHRIIVNGKVKWIRGKAYHEYDKDGVFDSAFGITQDITERKKAEEALIKAYDNLEKLVEKRTSQLETAYSSLKESEKSLAEAQKIAHIGNWEWDVATDKIYWSNELYRIYGRNPQEPGLTYNDLFSYVHPDDRDYVANAIKALLTGKPYGGIDYRMILANGEERTVHAKGEVVFDENNIPILVKGITQDITERKKAEEALEKIQEAHIKEIHHRIKNNLQVISSLLSLEAEKFSDEKILEAFRESQNRVISMALIHEELYKGNALETLDFSAYIQRLAANLFDSYNLGNSSLSLKLDIEMIHLDMDIAIPLGIIVNELVSNSLKHAFPAGRAGEIHISLCKKELFASNNDLFGPCPLCTDKDCFHYIFTVADNGKGIPGEIGFPNLDSLGLQLVNLLVEQIDGHIELKRDNGTKFAIWF